MSAQEIAGAAYALLARTIWEGPSLGPEEVTRAAEYQKKAEELRPKTAAAYYLRTMAALTIHEKLDLLTEAVRLERDHYPSRRLQALIHLASRRYEALKDDALMMTDRWPGDPLGYSLRAIAWRELGRYREAITDFNEALARTPRDDPQYVELAAKRCETFLRMADYKRVISEARECLTFLA